MKKRLFFGFTVGFCAFAGMVGAQSMPGLQTSFPPPGQGMKVFPTPQVSEPKGPLHVLRPFHPTPTPYQSRFYSLQPTPHPTPIRSQKTRPQPPQGAAALPAPRKLHYHSLYMDPTPTGARAVH